MNAARSRLACRGVAHWAAPGTVALALLAALSLFLWPGCGGGGGGLPSFESLFVSYYYAPPTGPAPFTARVGDGLRMLAFGRTAGGQDYPLGASGVWNSSQPAVASVSATGVLEALSPGATEVTVSQGGLTSGPLTITVEQPGPQPAADWYPLGSAFYWAYTGTPVSPTALGPQQAQVTLTVTCSTQVVIDGQVWWELYIRGTKPEARPSGMWLRHEGQGLREWVGGSSGSVWRLREPLQAGGQWSDPADPEHRWEIVSLSAQVTVPAGTFTGCLQVVERWVTEGGEPFQTTAWMAPGVGLVRTLTQYTDPDTGEPVDDERNLEQSLVQFQLGPP